MIFKIYCGIINLYVLKFMEAVDLDKLIKKILSVFPKQIQDFYCKHESVLLYLIVGAMTTVISIGTQYIAKYAGLPTEVNTTISWICAVTFAFFTNKVWVFKDESKTKKAWLSQAAAFYGARLVTYFMELGFMSFTVRVLEQNEYVMKLIAQVFILILNYLFSKLVIFRKKGDKERDV